MRPYRLMIVILLLLSLLIVGTAIAQEEATEEPEVTEVMEEPEMTEEPAESETPETTEEPEATEEPDTGDDETPVTDGSTYTVQPGDNLFRIALRFNLTTNTLAQANNIANPSLIFVGQVLTIPGGDVAPEPTAEPTDEPEATQAPEATEIPDSGEDTPVAGGSYTVQVGDNLFRIAVRNGTTVATLLDLNPSIANPNLIFVGQQITLPDGSTDATDDESADSSSDQASADDNATMLDVEMASGIEVFLSDDNIANASLATQLGVDWVKISVPWSGVEPVQGEFDFAALDSAIDAYDANFDIMLNLSDAPEWSRPSATDLANEQPTSGPPDDLSTFGDFAGAVAERYAGRVDGYEIWFQPNNRLSWMTTDVELRSDGFPDARLSDVRYIDLLEVAYDAIKAADSDALVITAGLAPTGNNDFYNSIDNFVFFEALLEQGAANFSDGFGVHVDGFSNAPDAECCGTADTDPQFDESYHFFFGETLDNFREILDRNGASTLPMWVTRFGWGTSENAAGDGANAPFVTLNTEQDQADYTVAALEAGDERGDVGAMIIYNLNGCVSGDNNSCYYSMINSSGEAREVFNAVTSR